jgi:nitroreductase
MTPLPPLTRRDDVLAFLRTRRSRPAKTLTTPVPDRAQLRDLLDLGARTPDHGKLEPWRFIVLERAACARLADLTARLGVAKNMEPERIEKSRRQFADASVVVAVVASPKPSEKIPQIEQTLSAGAVCQQVLTAALASGWGANWLSGWMACDANFLHEGLGITAPEYIAGFMHIGTETLVPPERPRPDIDTLTIWQAE